MNNNLIINFLIYLFETKNKFFPSKRIQRTEHVPKNSEKRPMSRDRYESLLREPRESNCRIYLKKTLGDPERVLKESIRVLIEC